MLMELEEYLDELHKGRLDVEINTEKELHSLPIRNKDIHNASCLNNHRGL